MNLRQTSDRTCDILATWPVLAALVLLLGLRPVLSSGQTIAPKEYPPGKEPYYYYSEDSAWYDSYGRLRYGPRGIPADEYSERQRARQRALQDQESTAPQVPAEVRVIHEMPRQGTPMPVPTSVRSGIPWGRMFWPGGVPPKEAHKGLIDWR